MKKTIATLLMIMALPVTADNCDKPRDNFDGLYCLNKVYQESDKELNTAYKELRKYLSDNEKNKLKKTQVTWINKRNKSCSLKKDGAFYVNLMCTTKTTIARTNTLRDRSRECKATGCQISKL